MMVQTAPEREPHFVITMKEHMDLCGQLARAYGNDRFESLRPYRRDSTSSTTTTAAGTTTTATPGSIQAPACPT